MPPVSLETARRFLAELERFELAALVEGGEYTFLTDDVDWFTQTHVELHLAPVCAEAVRSLAPADRERLAEAVAHTDSAAAELGVAKSEVVVRADEAVTVSPNTRLLAEMIVQRSVMIDVATNGVTINAVDDYYRARRRRIRTALDEREMSDPVPFESLWEWHHYWSQRFPSYRERRAYVRELFAETIAAVVARPQPVLPVRTLTGWERVDRALQKARHRLTEAHNEEDWQGVGLLCRETLISLAQAVYDRERHVPTDGVVPSDTDAKRMLEAFISAEVSGPSNETVRRHARASLALASELVHARTANERRALLCLEATQSTVAVIAILDGRQG